MYKWRLQRGVCKPWGNTLGLMLENVPDPTQGARPGWRASQLLPSITASVSSGQEALAASCLGGRRLCFRPQGRAHAPGHVLLTESAEDSSVSPASTTSTIIRRVKAGLGLEATSRRKAAGSGRESCRSPRGPQAGDVGSRRGAWAEAGGSVGAPAEGTRRGRAWKVGSINSRDIIPSRCPTA